MAIGYHVNLAVSRKDEAALTFQELISFLTILTEAIRESQYTISTITPMNEIWVNEQMKGNK